MLTLSDTLTRPFFESTQTLQLSDIAYLVSGRVLRDASFSNLGMFRTYSQKLLVVYFNPKFEQQLLDNAERFAAVLTTEALAASIPESLGVITCENPLDAFFNLHIHLAETEHPFYATRTPSEIDPSAKIHSSVVIAPFNVRIGAYVELEPNVVIHENSFIDEGTHIGCGTVIGGRGFEIRNINGKRQYIPHVGGVAIGKGVDIFVNTVVAKAVFKGATIIGDGCKIDNLVHLAHGAVIGRNVNLVGGASIGGTTRVGDNSWIGPSSVLSNSIIVGKDCWVALGSTVAQDVADTHRFGGPFSRRMP